MVASRERFQEVMDGLLAAAQPANPTLDSQAPFRTWFNIKEGITGLPGAKDESSLRVYLNGLRGHLVGQYLDEGKWEAAKTVTQCYGAYTKFLCPETEHHFVKRFHCGQRGCPTCALWLPDRFLRRKEEVLRQHLDEPCVFRISLGAQRVGPLSQERERDLSNLYQEIRRMLTHLTDNYGDSYAVAKDHIYGIRCCLRGELAAFDVAVLANHESPAKALLEEHFRKETGVEARVEEIACRGRKHAQDDFTSLMSVPLVWETLEDYQIWRAATGRVKLIQGKGVFYRASSRKAVPEHKPTTEGHERRNSCPICSECSPRGLRGYYPVSTTKVRQIESGITGGIYLEPVEDHWETSAAEFCDFLAASH